MIMKSPTEINQFPDSIKHLAMNYSYAYGQKWKYFDNRENFNPQVFRLMDKISTLRFQVFNIEFCNYYKSPVTDIIISKLHKLSK